MTTMSDLPPDVVRQGIVGRLNARSAARFAVASRNHSANALERVRALVESDRGAIRGVIDAFARPIAAKLVLMVKYIQRNAWRGRADITRPRRVRVPAFGSVGLYVVDHNEIQWHMPHASARVPVRRVRHRYMLDMPRVSFGWRLHEFGAASRRWLILSVIRRAIDMYNEYPVAHLSQMV